MTINTKDIEALVEQHCSSIHFMELGRLLKKLDNEDLHVLKDMLEEAYDSGAVVSDKALEMKYQSGYNRGYEDGVGESYND